MKIYYGIDDKRINVTDICLRLCVVNKILYIPTDLSIREELFGDPLYGIHKNIYIHNDAGELVKTYDDTTSVTFNTSTMKDLQEDIKVPDSTGKLQKIHETLTVLHGHITWEYEEQIMAVKFIKPDCKVLELGANIGRNTLVISSLLSDPTNLVALECDPASVAKLEENKSLNKYNFNIEPSALSKRKLIQKDWDTIPSEEVLEGYTRVNTITYSELMAKYNIPFDTIVADCEGALFYILTDMPEVLSNIKLILMENDYYNIEHKKFVDSVLIQQGFEKIYCKSGGWEPCYKFFWEAWQKSA